MAEHLYTCAHQYSKLTPDPLYTPLTKFGDPYWRIKNTMIATGGLPTCILQLAMKLTHHTWMYVAIHVLGTMYMCVLHVMLIA